jgi:hypothetical protein
MLTEQIGFYNAIGYIKDCALSKGFPLHYNENREKIVDSKELFGKKIAGVSPSPNNLIK